MFNIKVGYPSLEEETQIVEVTTRPRHADPQPILAAPQILRAQELVRRVPVASHVISYAVRLARATRPGSDEGRGIHEFVGWAPGRVPASIWCWGPSRAPCSRDGRHRESTT